MHLPAGSVTRSVACGTNDIVSDVVTLQEAAAALGVHYMTAYRYVRLGQLPAHKAGGTWQVLRSDLQQLVDENAAPGGSGATAAAGDRVVKGRVRRAPWAQRLEQRLLAGDTAGAWSVLEAAMAAGWGIEECYLEVIAPAMRSIGERWARGEIDIAVEHLATSITGRLIGRLGARTFRRGRSRGTVVLGAAAGERHSLPVAVLADLIRLAGWDIVDLGADVPAASFAHAARVAGDELVAVGVSCTTPESLGPTAESLAALRAAAPDALLLVGGLAIEGEHHARSLGADGFAADARGFIELLNGASPAEP